MGIGNPEIKKARHVAFENASDVFVVKHMSFVPETARALERFLLALFNNWLCIPKTRGVNPLAWTCLAHLPIACISESRTVSPLALPWTVWGPRAGMILCKSQHKTTTIESKQTRAGKNEIRVLNASPKPTRGKSVCRGVMPNS